MIPKKFWFALETDKTDRQTDRQTDRECDYERTNPSINDTEFRLEEIQKKEKTVLSLTVGWKPFS